MFTAGQRVWHRTGPTTGIVLECDGDRVYIEQDNGVELDFPATDLTTQPPAAAKPQAGHDAAAKSAHPPVPGRILTPRDITPDHARVLAAIPVRTLQAVAAIYERSPNAGRFSALDTAAKLNTIASITAVPYRTMHQYSDRPGELGLMMGKGLADAK